MHELRLMIFDKTQSALTLSWRVGALLYGALDRLDASFGAASWDEALEWLASFRAPERIREIQFWGHGKWGRAMIDRVSLDARALELEHRWNPVLSRIRDRLIDGGDALWWFRTCETFGREEGHQFARAWSEFFRCRVAGHTYVIALAQSGLHVIRPGERPTWPIDEGLPAREGDGPIDRARWSSFRAPNTISCFHGRIPPSCEPGARG